MYYHLMPSPIGELLLAGEEDALRCVHFQGGPRPLRPEPDWEKAEKPFREVIRQLRAYFNGKLQKFDLPLAPEGTEFQMRVWRALREIPYGETWSYGQLARRIRKPQASRAVGAANGQNPIPIIVPCHRVIGANGSLTGFGGGLPIKRALLELESGVRSLI
ncbi:MAG TPA: methylated-DNA--[protein]-cysteine S-methyltransferase [Gammaproteobacteria bacterium]|nr:methylated-DNA--[protein]-cysteine S-methyltransferase [Gammaproteobacteria bacterium]